MSQVPSASSWPSLHALQHVKILPTSHLADADNLSLEVGARSPAKVQGSVVVSTQVFDGTQGPPSPRLHTIRANKMLPAETR
jgi:hypothetical protein